MACMDRAHGELIKLKLSGMRAEGLRNTLFLGKMDPRATIRLWCGKFDTHVAKDAGTNPEWTTTVEGSIRNMDETVIVDIFHDNTTRSTDFLGRVHTTVQQLLQYSRVGVPLPVVSNGKCKGLFFANVSVEDPKGPPHHAMRAMDLKSDGKAQAHETSADLGGLDTSGSPDDIVDQLENLVQSILNSHGGRRTAADPARLVADILPLLVHDSELVQWHALVTLGVLCNGSADVAAALAQNGGGLKRVMDKLEGTYRPGDPPKAGSLSNVAAQVLVELAAYVAKPTEERLRKDPGYARKHKTITDALFKANVLDALLAMFTDDDVSNDVEAAQALALLTENPVAATRVKRRGGARSFQKLLDAWNTGSRDEDMRQEIVSFAEHALKNLEDSEA